MEIDIKLLKSTTRITCDSSHTIPKFLEESSFRAQTEISMKQNHVIKLTTLTIRNISALKLIVKCGISFTIRNRITEIFIGHIKDTLWCREYCKRNSVRRIFLLLKKLCQRNVKHLCGQRLLRVISENATPECFWQFHQCL